jgi:hypothetical protein
MGSTGCRPTREARRNVVARPRAMASETAAMPEGNECTRGSWLGLTGISPRPPAASLRRSGEADGPELPHKTCLPDLPTRGACRTVPHDGRPNHGRLGRCRRGGETNPPRGFQLRVTAWRGEPRGGSKIAACPTRRNRYGGRRTTASGTPRRYGLAMSSCPARVARHRCKCTFVGQVCPDSHQHRLP